MRVLHLIDAASDQACPTTLALVSDSVDRLGDIEQRVALLGGTRLREMAKAVGLRFDLHRGVPFGSAVHAWAMMPSWVRAHGSFDLVHGWSIGAATLASVVMPRTPRVVTLTAAPTARQAHWLRMLGAAGELLTPSTYLAISSTIQRELLVGGVAQERAHVLRPGIDMGRVSPQRRSELRAQWGATGEGDDQTRFVALLSDPPAAGDALEAIWAVGLANLSDREGRPPITLVVTADQHRRVRAQRLTRVTGRADSLLVDRRLERPWEVLPGCDAALALGPTAGGLSLLWAMAAGVPIIGEARYAVSEIVEDRHSALLVKPDRATAVAHRISQLFADQQLAWQLRDTARHEAYSFFSRVRYCQSLARVYEQVTAGKPVEVPPLEATGGMRFAGRA